MASDDHYSKMESPSMGRSMGSEHPFRLAAGMDDERCMMLPARASNVTPYCSSLFFLSLSLLAHMTDRPKDVTGPSSSPPTITSARTLEWAACLARAPRTMGNPGYFEQFQLG
ncbi:hypothetical protein V8C44DRAFT_328170 [Trichoderma aethiopicum]